MRARSIVASLVVVAVVAIAGALFFQQPTGSPTIPAAPPRADASPAAASSPAPLTARRVPADADDAAADSTAAARGAKTTVDGTVVVTDLDGRPALVDNDDPTLHTLRAHWIGGIRLHVVDEETHRELDEVEIVRRKNFGVRRTSFDADSSALLESFHPGPAAATETLLEHGVSPLVVYPRVVEGEMTISDEWHIRAAGHAWARIDFNFEAALERTFERTLELGAGATLIVNVEGELPRRIEATTGTPIVPKFRLCESVKDPIGNSFHSRETLIAAEPAALGEFRVESLQAGPIVASIECDPVHGLPRAVASVAATLAPGSTTRVALVIPPQQMPKAVPLAGTLFVPAGWKIPDAHLLIRPEDLVDSSDADQRDLPLSQMEPLSGRPGWLRWNTGSVLPATYAFQVDAAGFAHAVVVDTAGDDHVELTLPEPARLDVRLVDVATGAPAQFEGVCWRSDPDETMRWSPASIALARAADGSHYSGVVPIGTGALRWSDDHEWICDPATTITTIHADEPQRTISIRRVVGLVLELSHGSTRVPWSDELSWRCTIEPVDHAGSVAWQRGLLDGSFRIDVTDAGAYRVTIPTIPGFAPVDPFEINLPAGRLITRIVYLTKP